MFEWLEKILIKRLDKKKMEVQRLKWNKAMLEAKVEAAKKQSAHDN